ncbi:MAG: hypothetical protein ACOX2U_03275 [Limisphaerales bacterium]|jgi:hypothetical protein|nr:hypothetical protein [Verrucomicrobiota bacterium]
MNMFWVKLYRGLVGSMLVAALFCGTAHFSQAYADAEVAPDTKKTKESQERKNIDPVFPLKLQLIWGTDTNIDEVEHLKGRFKEVKPEIQKRLEEFLKWNHYYEISCKKVDLKEPKEYSVVMSKHCEIKIRKIENEKEVVEVKLYGKDKMVVRKKARITAKKPQSIAGKTESTSDFWCVLISVDDDPTGEKEAARKKAEELKALKKEKEKESAKTEEKK